MSTKDQLIKMFGTEYIPLDDASHRILKISKEHAYRKANTQSLPFPAFKDNSSKKGRWFVKASDLAHYLDSLHSKGLSEWISVNGKPWNPFPEKNKSR